MRRAALLPLAVLALAGEDAWPAPPAPNVPDPFIDLPPPPIPPRTDGITGDDVVGLLGDSPPEERALDIRVGGYLSESLRLDTHDRRSTGAAFFDAWTRAYLFMEAKFGASTKFRLTAAADQFTPVDRGGASPRYSTDLGEAYLLRTWGGAQVKMGLQLVSWGVMDAYGPEDHIGARDRRFSIVQPSEQGLYRVPQLAARTLVPLGDRGTLDLVFVPLAVPDRFLAAGGDFALLRPGLGESLLAGFRARVASDLPPASQEPYLRVADGLEELLDGLRGHAEMDGGALSSFERGSRYGPEDFEGGMRMSGRLGPFAFGAAALAARERSPQIRVSPALRAVFFGLSPLTAEEALAFTSSLRDQIDVRFLRYYLGGADVSLHLGSFAVKAEAAYRTAATYYTTELDVVSRPRLEAALHLEYLRGSTVAIVLEGVVHHVFDDATGLAFATQDEVRVLGRCALSLLRETLKLRLDGAYEVAYRDYYVAPALEYFWTDRFSVAVGAEIFGGPKAEVTYDGLRRGALARERFGAFSYYRDGSFVFTKLKYGF